MKFNAFYVVLAVYITLIYLIATSGVSHALIIGLLIGYLLVDRLICQMALLVIGKTLMNVIVKAKSLGVDLSLDSGKK